MKSVKVELKIDNKDVPSPVVESIDLHQVLGNHHEFTLELRRRHELEQIYGSSLEENASAWLSKTISIKFTAADKSDDDADEVRFIGIISAVNFSSSVDSLGNIIIKGYSPTIMMDINKMYRTWLDLSSGDIINSLVADENLPNSNVTASGGTTHPGLLAYGDTPYQMLNYIAVLEGWWAYYDGLNFNVVEDLPDESIELKANNLEKFTVELDTTRLKSIDSSAFDYIKGSLLQASSPNPAQSSLPLGKIAGESEKLSKSQEKIVMPHNPISQQDIDQKVQKALKQSYAKLVKSNGKTSHLGLHSGKCLKVKWVPKAKVTESRGEEGFDGLYLLTRVKHHYKDGKYDCEFNCVARDLACPYCTVNQLPAHLTEQAWVVDIDDPEGKKLGRAKVCFPWDIQGAENVESPFIRVCQPQAGSDDNGSHGNWLMPELGDNVMVAIRGRHLENAFILGSVYEGSQPPKDDVYHNENMVKAIYTKSGNEIMIKDDKDAEQIAIKTKGDSCSMIMDASKDAEKYSVAVKTDGAKLVLDGKGGSEKISMETKGSSCTISLDASKKAITIEAGTALTLKADKINIEAGKELNMKSNGKLVQKAAAAMDINASGNVVVKGAVIQLN
ncbi:MAG: hypothetical protein J7K40_07705 [candidate division Zixibacteria bacterium]|nr:hypothetical protein [candidate division Zixibacteria bacterium]